VQHQTEAPDPNEIIADAQKAAAGMKAFSGIVLNPASATDNVQSGLDTIDKFSSIIEPLKVFNSFAEGIGKVLAFIFTLYVTDVYV
jgi:dihydroorotase